jgi:hypothetical protein
MRRYRSFLVRRWDLQSGEQRIEVHDLQSGQRALVTTAAAAIACIDGWGTEHERKEEPTEEGSGADEIGGTTNRPDRCGPV